MRWRSTAAAMRATSTPVPIVHCSGRRFAGAVWRTITRATLAMPTTVASTSTVGEAENRARNPATTTEGIAMAAASDCERHSTTNVITAITAMSPSMLRVPNSPWIGPPSASLPWIPRKRNGMSRRMPLMISAMTDAASRIRRRRRAPARSAGCP